MRRSCDSAASWHWLRTATAISITAESPVDRDLALLLDELWSLDRQLGDLASYKDFSFLLDYLTQTAQKERPSSGYSR